MCGGTLSTPVATTSITGLSPRVRGNRRDCPHPGGRHRTIPACAGEPNAGPTFGSWTRDYPRVCGGTRPRLTHGDGAGGLSPRVRGNHSVIGCAYGCPWTIPACAGEPARGPDVGKGITDYPRVCGGTQRIRRGGLANRGLSPRVRGNQPRPWELAEPSRTIPACAGEPAARIRRVSKMADYPRVCGGTYWRYL